MLTLEGVHVQILEPSSSSNGNMEELQINVASRAQKLQLNYKTNRNQKR